MVCAFDCASPCALDSPINGITVQGNMTGRVKFLTLEALVPGSSGP